MPNTVGGAVRAAVVASGIVNARVFRDAAPDGVTFPYCTYLDPLSTIPRTLGDGVVLTRETQVQWSLWQRVRDEDDTLVPALVDAIEGAALVNDSGRKLWRARVSSVIRIPDPESQYVHHALTVAVRHAGV
jgi:hypothetical protein